MERWGRSELGVAGAPARPDDMQADDVFVRAGSGLTRLAGERVFGDVVEMLVRREDGKLRIAAYGEVAAP